MKRFWTADLHFNHAAICIYCNRPWLRKADIRKDEITGADRFASRDIALDTAERMNKGLIKNINSRVKDEDVVVCVGDFMTYGRAKGVDGLKIKSSDILSELNGSWCLIKGNHDKQNKVKIIASHMTIDIGPYKAFVSHYPLENLNVFNPKLIDYVINYTDFQIVGHIHSAWKSKVLDIKDKKYLMYNVGIDVHNYYPINDMEIIEDIDKLKKSL